MRAVLASVAAILISLCSGVQAASPLGTAGPFRLFGWAQCAAGIMAQFQGGCDPKAVDAALPPQKRADARIERALTLLSFARVPQAKDELDAAIADDPRNVRALTLRARAEIPGNADLIEQLLNAGLSLAPTDADLLATRAFVLFGNRDLAGATRDAGRALAADFGNADAHWVRAVIYEQTGRLAEAEHDLSHALLVEPDNLRARLFRGRLRLKANDLSGAIADAEVLLKSRVHAADALQIRAAARYRMRDLEGSVADLNQILGAPGENTSAAPSIARFNGLYMQRASALARLGKTDLAIKDVDRLIRAGDGPRAILRMQVYLRAHGFPKLEINGQRSPTFDKALTKCLVDEACGRAIEEPFS